MLVTAPLPAINLFRKTGTTSPGNFPAILFGNADSSFFPFVSLMDSYGDWKRAGHFLRRNEINPFHS
jgi:hypothetical protein